MYYTNKHEWIEYSGHNALVGICKNKLSGASDIESIAYCDILSNIEQGTAIATLYTRRGSFDVYMPVDGKIVGFNKKLLENPSLVLNGEPGSIWIAKISPNAPYKRDGLLQVHQYKLLHKNGQAIING